MTTIRLFLILTIFHTSYSYSQEHIQKPTVIPTISFRIFDLGVTQWNTEEANKKYLHLRGWIGIEYQPEIIHYEHKLINALKITHVFLDSPADQAQIQVGDYLVKGHYKKLKSDEIIRHMKHTYIHALTDHTKLKKGWIWFAMIRSNSTHIYTKKDIHYQKVKLIPYNLFTQVLTESIARLDFHSFTLQFPKDKEVRVLYSALFNDQKRFNCDQVGVKLASLQKTHTGKDLLSRLQAGDLIVMRGITHTLMAMFNGPSLCIDHSTLTRNRIRVRTFEDSFNHLTLSYRKNLIQRWNQSQK